MGIELPGWLRWVGGLVGEEFPEGDETACRRQRDRWQHFADELQRHQDGLAAARRTTLDGFASGQLHEAMQTEFNTLTTGEQSIDKIIEQLRQLAHAVDEAATEIEFAKEMFIVNLGILAVSLAAMIASAWINWGAPAEMAAAIAVTEAVLSQIIRAAIGKLVSEAALRVISRLAIKALEGGVINAAMSGAMNAAVQGQQILQGNRHGFDLGSIGDDTLSGGLQGAVAAPFLRGVGERTPGLHPSERLSEFTRSFTGNTLGGLAAQAPSGQFDLGRAVAGGALFGGMDSVRPTPKSVTNEWNNAGAPTGPQPTSHVTDARPDTAAARNGAPDVDVPLNLGPRATETASPPTNSTATSSPETRHPVPPGAAAPDSATSTRSSLPEPSTPRAAEPPGAPAGRTADSVAPRAETPEVATPRAAGESAPAAKAADASDTGPVRPAAARAADAAPSQAGYGAGARAAEHAGGPSDVPAGRVNPERLPDQQHRQAEAAPSVERHANPDASLRLPPHDGLDRIPKGAPAPGSGGRTLEGTGKRLPPWWELRDGADPGHRDQPGGGKQWAVVDIRDARPRKVSIDELVDGGYLTVAGDAPHRIEPAHPPADEFHDTPTDHRSNGEQPLDEQHLMLGGEDLTPEQRQHLRDVWSDLTSDERRSLYRRDPMFGEHAGLPVEVCDHYARQAVDDLITGQDPGRLRLLADLRESVRNRDDAPPRFLLGFDLDGRSITAVGNPGTAAATVVFVPGTFTSHERLNPAPELPGLKNWFGLKHRFEKPGYMQICERLHERLQASLDRENVAVIDYQNYHAPQSLVPGAARPGYAEQGAAALRNHLDRLQESNDTEGGRFWVTGHSYGTTVVGEAAQGHRGLNADGLINLGSPGMRVHDVSELMLKGENQVPGAAPVHTMTRVDDPIHFVDGARRMHLDELGIGHGLMPHHPGFGGHVWDVDTAAGRHRDPHNAYFDADNIALQRIADILAGEIPPSTGPRVWSSHTAPPFTTGYFRPPAEQSPPSDPECDDNSDDESDRNPTGSGSPRTGA